MPSEIIPERSKADIQELAIIRLYTNLCLLGMGHEFQYLDHPLSGESTGTIISIRAMITLKSRATC
jgi:hypothetical protein